LFATRHARDYGDFGLCGETGGATKCADRQRLLAASDHGANRIVQPMKYTLRVLSAVAGLCFLGTICFLLWPKELKERLGDDVFKLTYQFLLLVVIGGALSVVYQEFQRHRDDEAKQREQDAARREAERVLQRQFLADLVEVYQAAMKVRRLLQAKAREHIPATTVMLVHANPYEEQMLALLDVHLDFQSLESRAETISLSRPITAKLAANPRSIDKYFNEIVSEYADHFSAFTGQPPTRQLNELGHVADFIAKYNPESTFAIAFRKPFRAAVATLQGVIIQRSVYT